MKKEVSSLELVLGLFSIGPIPPFPLPLPPVEKNPPISLVLAKALLNVVGSGGVGHISGISGGGGKEGKYVTKSTHLVTYQEFAGKGGKGREGLLYYFWRCSVSRLLGVRYLGSFFTCWWL